MRKYLSHLRFGHAPSLCRVRASDSRTLLHFWRSRLLTLSVMGVIALGLSTLLAQTAPKPDAATTASAASKVAAIKSFRIVQEKDGPAVEILSTRPLVPAIQLINDPTRLVIDLPNARLDTPQKRVSVQADQISTLRADQFQQNPPVARVVVDLLAPRTYTWDAAGNRLVIHLGKNPTEASRSPFEAPQVVSLKPAPAPVVKAIRAAGPLAIAAETGNVGSSFTAADDTAVLRLSSGGEVHVCPGTTVSITPSQSQHNLMLGMNTGALETHMQLDASTDAVMTPDFRITLVGPGEFHYAFSADNQGNTCVRALPGNTASAIVTELLGDRTYQVKATDQLVFRGGQLDHVDMNVPVECGCPPSRQEMHRAINNLPEQNAPQTEARPATTNSNTPPDPPATNSGPGAQPVPNDATTSAAPPANEMHVQITAPLVFKADGPPPAPVEDVGALPLDSHRMNAPELTAGVPPSTQPPAQPAAKQPATATREPSRGFFHKLGRFFSSLFR